MYMLWVPLDVSGEAALIYQLFAMAVACVDPLLVNLQCALC